MGNPSNNQHYSLLVPHWNDLMAIRKFITDNKHNPANIDADVAKVFDPEAYDAIRKRLGKVNELSAIGRQMKDMGVDSVAIDFAIVNVFEPEAKDTFEEDVAKWKQLVGVRAQMKGTGIGTGDIERFIADIFKLFRPVICSDVQIDDHYSTPQLATQEPIAALKPVKEDSWDEPDPANCAQASSSSQIQNVEETVKIKTKPRKTERA